MSSLTRDVELRIDVHITTPVGGTQGAYGDLHISETVEIPVSSFSELAKILWQFHDLAQEIKRERA